MSRQRIGSAGGVRPVREPRGVGAPRCQFIFSGKNDELTPDFSTSMVKRTPICGLLILNILHIIMRFIYNSSHLLTVLQHPAWAALKQPRLSVPARLFNPATPATRSQSRIRSHHGAASSPENPRSSLQLPGTLGDDVRRDCLRPVNAHFLVVRSREEATRQHLQSGTGWSRLRGSRRPSPGGRSGGRRGERRQGTRSCSDLFQREHPGQPGSRIAGPASR